MTTKRYRIRQHDSVLRSFGSLKAAAEYLDALTIDRIPGRQANATVEHDVTGEWDWKPVETARRHLHHQKSGWRECWRPNCKAA